MKEALHQDIKWIANGQVNLSGDVLDLYNQLDELFVKLATIKNAKVFKFPNFIEAKELNKIDYFKSFPHLINFPVNLKSEEQNLKEFVNGEKCTSEGVVKLKELNPVCDCLTPAACYHFYIHYQNTSQTKPLYVTTLANCYRKEDFYIPLERLWNFTMREIVCLGTPEEVKEFLDFYREKVTKIFEKLKLNISWDVATDPFFDPSNSPKFLMQTLLPVKYEMVFNGTLSIGSTNYHRTYFGDTFDIKRDNQSISTGCIAFGMERWLFAILTQFGNDKKNWPDFMSIIGEI